MALGTILAAFTVISADTVILGEDMRADRPAEPKNAESLTRAARDGSLPQRYGALEVDVDSFSHMVERTPGADIHTVSVTFTNRGEPGRIWLAAFAEGSARDSDCPKSAYADTGERVVVRGCFALPSGMRADAAALVGGGASGLFLGNPLGAYHVFLFDLSSPAPVPDLACAATDTGVSCG